MTIENLQDSSDKIVRDDRLDFVKAIGISLVLIWHFRPIKIVVEKGMSTGVVKTAKFILEQAYLNLTLIAVPLFILTSLFLLFKKLETTDFKYFFKRCRRLLDLFIFWVCFQFFVYYCTSFFYPARLNYDIYKLLQLAVDGGPILPLVGESVFYFLFVLIVLTVVSGAFFYLKSDKLKNRLGLAVIIFYLIYFETLNLANNGLRYWGLANFWVYIPIAYFLFKQKATVANQYIVIYYICCLCFGIQDIILRADNYSIGIYSRLSIVFGALAVFSSCLRLKDWKASESVKFLSKFCLGIFAIHKYWQFMGIISIQKLFEILGFSESISIGEIKISALNIFLATASTFCTLVSVYLLERSPLQKFIK